MIGTVELVGLRVPSTSIGADAGEYMGEYKNLILTFVQCGYKLIVAMIRTVELVDVWVPSTSIGADAGEYIEEYKNLILTFVQYSYQFDSSHDRNSGTCWCPGSIHFHWR